MAKELSLKWDDHHGTLIRVFEELLETNTLVDCTIAAEGQYVKAHKMVLSACSPYFQLLFAQENEKNPIVVLKDIKFEELKALIDFMYRGVVKIQEDQLKKFVEVAESLQVKGLAGQNVNTTSQSTANKNAGSKDGRTSPVPRKRRRNNSSNVIEEKRSTFSPPENNSSDSSSHGSNVPCEVALDIPTSSALAAPSSSGISTVASASPVALRPPIEREKLASTSKAKAPSLMVPLPDPETVVKSEPETDEPEPLTEIFLPETKNEEYVDDMALLHSGEGSTEAPPGDSQQSANQYSGFPTMYESSSDSFMQQIADSSNTQDAASTDVREDFTDPRQWVTVVYSPPDVVADSNYLAGAGKKRRTIQNRASRGSVTRTALQETNPQSAPSTRPRKSVQSVSRRKNLQHAIEIINVESSEVVLKSGDLNSYGPTATEPRQEFQDLSTVAAVMDAPQNFETKPLASAKIATDDLLLNEKRIPCVVLKRIKPPNERHQNLKSSDFNLGIAAVKCQSGGVEGSTSAIRGVIKRKNHHLSCHSCKKIFRSQSNLDTHMLNHNKYRSYACDLCSMRFTHKLSLKHHKQKNHKILFNSMPKTLKLNKTCSYCGKAFPSPSKLHRHIRVHSRERPFQCKVCCKLFTYKASLVRHQKQHVPKSRFLVKEDPDHTSPGPSTHGSRLNKLSVSKKKTGAFSPSVANGDGIGQNVTLKTDDSTSSGAIDSQRDQAGFECKLCGKRVLHEIILQCHMRAIHNVE